MINLRMLKLSDPLLWMAAVGLLIFGFLSIYSSTHALQMRIDLDPFLFVKRQFISLVVGMVGLAIFAYLDYKRLIKMAPYLYAFMLFMLAAILFGGESAQGAQRWFQFGPFSFQPSEISKIIGVVNLAFFLSTRKKLHSLWDVILLLILVGIPFLLIFKQPDLGTALVFVFILIGMLAGSWSSPRLLTLLVTPMISLVLRPFIYIWIIYLILLVVILFLLHAEIWDWIIVLGVNIGVGVAMPFIWGMLKAYQRNRIMVFINPESDPYGAGYHSIQSKIAIGNGGIFGRGFLHGSQTQLQFIPEQHSDFIFSVVGEEFGFIGAVLVILFFAVIVWRAWVAATQADSYFGALLAIGIAVMMTIHVLANIGMALGLLPVVGIPLPFVSYGGSSLLMNMIVLGLLQSIFMRRQKIIF